MPQNPPNNHEAILKLKILNGEDLKEIRFVGKTKSFILAWINPSFKQSTKTLTTSTKNPTWNYDLSFPLSLQTLQNPNSILTIQIISPSSPIHHKRVIGTTILSISQIQFDENLFTLQLWRPSGRAHGLIRVSAKIVIEDLGFYTPVGCVTGVPIEMNLDESQPLIVDQIESSRYHHHYHQPVVPSAPLLVEDELMELAVGNDLVDSVETNSVELLPCSDDGIDRMDNNVVNDCDSAGKSSVQPVASDGPNVLRSLLVGFLGGAVAVATVLVGSSNG